MPAHSDKSGSIDNGVNQDGPGWKSRQRTTLPALPRLQHGISFSNVYNKDRKENFDGLTDSFVNLIYKRNTPVCISSSCCSHSFSTVVCHCTHIY